MHLQTQTHLYNTCFKVKSEHLALALPLGTEVKSVRHLALYSIRI